MGRGLLIGSWGAVAYLPTLGLVAEPWLVWVNCAIWAVVYMRTPPSLRLAAAQVVATVAPAVAGSLWREWGAHSLLAVAPGLFHFVVWMAPVGIVASFRKDGADQTSVAHPESSGSEAS